MSNGPQTGYTQGTDLHGELSTANASAGLEVPLYGPDGRIIHVGPNDELFVITMSLLLAAGGAAYFYADVTSGAGVAVANTTDNSFSINGDASRFLAAGVSFTVYGSTGNDAGYTSLGALYDPVTGQTTVSVDSVTNATADGILAWITFDVVEANSTLNLIRVAGDQTRYFHVGQEFRIDGSTGNDNGGSNYTVTSASYEQDTDRTVIGVASIVSDVGDGRVIPQPTDRVGRRYIAGTYAANGGREREFNQRVQLAPGYTVFMVAAVGQADAEMQAFLRKAIPAV